MPKDGDPKALEELKKQARASRARLEPEWYMDLAYYSGNQWMYWDGRQLVRPQLSKSRVTITDNRITGAVRLTIAKMTKQRPIWEVAPETEDQSDVNAAMMAEQIMRFLWFHLKMQEMDRKGLEWAQICGAGFFKVLWDPTIGPPVDVLTGPDGSPITDSSGAPVNPEQIDPETLTQQLGTQVQKSTVHQGDLRVEVRSPFQMFIDPLCDSFDEAEWLVEESIKSVDYVQQRYNQQLKPDATANPGLVEARLGQVYSPGSTAYKGVKLSEYWCKANADHPQGYRAVFAQDKLLFEDEKPFDAFPYVMLSGIPTPGRLWPMSPVGLLRPPQTQLNKLVSQIIENLSRVGNPTVLASKQAVQDPEKFADSMSQPGGVYFFDDVGSPNTVPQFLQAPGLPNYIQEMQASVLDSIQDIAGQHDVNQAQTPAGVTAASAINLLQEADDTRLGPMITDHEFQLAALGKKLLCHVAQFYTDARTIRLPGDNGSWEIYDFRGNMLKGNTHVSVQAGSAFPQSKAAKQAMIQEMLTYFVQSGQPLQGRQLGQWLRDVEVGGVERLIDELSVDEGQIDRENVLMYQGVAVQLNPQDDDQAHIQGHEDEMKSAKFFNQSPQVQNIFQTHLAATQERYAEAQQAQAAAANPEPAADPNVEAQGQAQTQGAQIQNAVQAAQGQQQVSQATQEQGYSAAQNEQGQRHAEESHQQGLRHAEEQHQAKLKQISSQQGSSGGRVQQR